MRPCASCGKLLKMDSMRVIAMKQEPPRPVRCSCGASQSFFAPSLMAFCGRLAGFAGAVAGSLAAGPMVFGPMEGRAPLLQATLMFAFAGAGAMLAVALFAGLWPVRSSKGR